MHFRYGKCFRASCQEDELCLGDDQLKIDVKRAFLQSGFATRDIYVIPPRKCTDRRISWMNDDVIAARGADVQGAVVQHRMICSSTGLNVMQGQLVLDSDRLWM